MTLLEARMQGRLADSIFFPRILHPDLRAMLNPEALRKASKRKASPAADPTPKKARIAALEERGFDDGGFGDTGFADTGFGDMGFGDDSFRAPVEEREESVLGSEFTEPLEEEEEVPTSISGNMSASTIAAATLLHKELPSSGTQTLSALTRAQCGARGVAREDAVKMFFEVLVLASRDLVRVRQEGGYAEIRVGGKAGLFERFGGAVTV